MFLSSCGNTIFNQSARVFSWGCFLKCFIKLSKILRCDWVVSILSNVNALFIYILHHITTVKMITITPRRNKTTAPFYRVCTFPHAPKLTTNIAKTHRLGSFLSRYTSSVCRPYSRYDCSCPPDNVPGPYTARAQIGGTFSCRSRCTHRMSTLHSVCP